jgi:hypothetical protein
MPRSLKKGPYVDEKLLKRIQELNRTNAKRVIKTWSRRSMAKNSCRCLSLRIWLVTSSGNFRRLEPSVVTPAKKSTARSR